MQRIIVIGAALRNEGFVRSISRPCILESSMTEFTFIRHGETDWNRQARFQGQIDVPLNAAGLLQAERLAARLSGHPPAVLYASDLQRAQQTAAALARVWQLEVHPLPAFREQSFGILEGMEVAAVPVQHPDLWAHWVNHATDFALPGGGESLRQFHDRVIEGVRQLAVAHPGRRLAVVTHGGVLDMLWRHAKSLPLEGRRDCAIPNTGVNRLQWTGDKLEIEVWADASHLEGIEVLG
jgi:2,3-bisphosphoglycerate-dependent phosphoglycerate mutase